MEGAGNTERKARLQIVGTEEECHAKNRKYSLLQTVEKFPSLQRMRAMQVQKTIRTETPHPSSC